MTRLAAEFVASGLTGRDETRRWLEGRGLGEAVEKALGPALAGVWRDGYVVGAVSSRAVLSHHLTAAVKADTVTLGVDWGAWNPGDAKAAELLLGADGMGAGLQALLQQSGVVLKGIASTKLDQIARVLAAGLAAGDAPGKIATALRSVVDDAKWAIRVALTETTRAVSAATVARYARNGVPGKEWASAGDQRVCGPCGVNQDVGAIPLDGYFPDGNYAPPGHTLCRCSIYPSWEPVGRVETPPQMQEAYTRALAAAASTEARALAAADAAFTRAVRLADVAYRRQVQLAGQAQARAERLAARTAAREEQRTAAEAAREARRLEELAAREARDLAVGRASTARVGSGEPSLVGSAPTPAGKPSGTAMRKRVADAGITVPTGLRPQALERLVADLDHGVPAATARARAVESIVDERKAVAEALAGASEQVGREASERALKAEARAIRNAVPAEALPQFKPLLEALDAGDLEAARAALPAVAKAANLTSTANAGEVMQLSKIKGRVNWEGSARGDVVEVLRPGYSTTVEREVRVLRHTDVIAASPEQVAALRASTPAKVAKKAAPRKATAMTPAEFDALVEQAAKGTPALRSAPLEFDAEARGAARAGRGFEDAFPNSAERTRIVKALSDYQFLSHKEITQLMRTGTHRVPAVLSPEATKAAIADIRSALSRSALDRPVVVWRGANIPELSSDAVRFGDLTGVEWSDPAFISASIAERTARKFTGYPGDVVMQIVAPRGTPAIQLSKARGRGAEGELLLGDGLRFRVVRDRGMVDGVRVVDVEVVPKGAPAKAAVRKATPAKKVAPKAPAPEKMTLPAVRNTLTQAGLDAPAMAPRAALNDAVTALRGGTPQARVADALRRADIEQRTVVARTLADLVAGDLDAARARLAALATTDPAAVVLKPVLAAADGTPARLKTAIKAAQRKAGLKQVGEDAGTRSTFDKSAMKPIGKPIPDGAPVKVVTPGYEIEVGGQRIVLSKPVVEKVEGVQALPRTAGRAETPTVAAKATNPAYGSTINGPVYRTAGKAGLRWMPDMGPAPFGAFEENCTNVVHAFEMRMRGFDVVASPLDILDRYGYGAGRTYAELDQLLTSAWRTAGGGAFPVERTIAGQLWRSFAQIDAEIVQDWPEGGRGFIFVGKHIFNVVKKGGQARYFEAQHDATATRDVTALYRKKYRSDPWQSGPKAGLREEAKLVRVDDLVPTDGILEAVQELTP